MSQDLGQFRQEVRNWLGDNFPQSLIGRGIEPFGGVEEKRAFQRTLAVGEIGWEKKVGERPLGPPSTAVAGSRRPKQQSYLRKCTQPGQSTRSRYLLEWA